MLSNGKNATHQAKMVIYMKQNIITRRTYQQKDEEAYYVVYKYLHHTADTAIGLGPSQALNIENNRIPKINFCRLRACT